MDIHIIFGHPYLSDSMKLSEKSQNTPYYSTYATTHALTPRTHATVPWEHCFRCDTRVPPDGNRTRAGKLAHLASCQLWRHGMRRPEQRLDEVPEICVVETLGLDRSGAGHPTCPWVSRKKIGWTPGAGAPRATPARCSPFPIGRRLSFGSRLLPRNVKVPARLPLNSLGQLTSFS